MQSESKPPEFWQQVKDIFDELWELPPTARLAALGDLCLEEDAVREEVERMLAALGEAGDFMEKPLIVDPASFDLEEQIGRHVGVYQLIRPLGRGGMGAVFLARRTDDSDQPEVAVKLITPALDFGEAGWRFKRERQILAQLNHPNIAKLLDGGKTEDGWPYLVMEYVSGLPITKHCDYYKLSISERLALFIKVCEAVEHAHLHLIIHRDIKPGNVFVTEDNAVKLLDFGIAKLIKPSEHGVPLNHTRSGARIMTTEYASPEQVLGGDIGEASDIYSLGVVFYELLTGHRPHRFRNLAIGEVVRKIRDEEVLAPSAAITRTVTEIQPDGKERTIYSPEKVGDKRSISPEQLRKIINGDLDRIALKALHKDVRHRYYSVRELRDDLSRYLQGQPVQAHRDTLGYRAAKFAKRHKEGVITAIALISAMTLVLLLLLYFLRPSRP